MEREAFPSGVTNLLCELIPLVDKRNLPRLQINLVTNNQEVLPFSRLWLTKTSTMIEDTYCLIEMIHEVPFKYFDHMLLLYSLEIL